MPIRPDILLHNKNHPTIIRKRKLIRTPPNINKNGIRISSSASIIRNNHFLSAAPYCLQAVSRDMIGIAFSNTQPSMGFPGAKRSVIGNNPIGFGVPTAGEFPIVFDSALTVSGGKIGQYIREGRFIPEEFQALDENGEKTRDPVKVGGKGTVMPIGGYKGAGLALLVEIQMLVDLIM